MIDSITAITLSHEMIVPVVFIDRFILFDKDLQHKIPHLLNENTG